MAKRIAFKVDGKVQGVFYRGFTEEQAQKLGLTGFVKNESSGHVSGEAQGDEGKLNDFLKQLEKGPSAAQVTGVEHSNIPTKDGEKSFSTSG